jgi:hypothetical protein
VEYTRPHFLDILFDIVDEDLDDYDEYEEEDNSTAEVDEKIQQLKDQRWRSAGHNSNRRGAGTSRSTVFAKEKKGRDLAASAQANSQDLRSFFPTKVHDGMEVDLVIVEEDEEAKGDESEESDEGGDGLDAKKLNLSDGGKNVPLLRSTTFVNAEGVIVQQSMQTDAGKQKGIQSILAERGKFKNDFGHSLRKMCHGCNTLKGAQLKEYHESTRQCCGTRVLSEEPDFARQQEYLAEEVEKWDGCSIIFYPKYHCELNFIEMVWGWTKCYHRRSCTYNFKDLERELPITYTTRLPLDFVQKAFMYCLRFMSGYREGLVGPELDYAVKKYRGHRSIPVGQLDLIKSEFEKKHERKASGSKRKR